ncbi:NDR1/HIN1-like protein 13 [Linum perenne]
MEEGVKFLDNSRTNNNNNEIQKNNICPQPPSDNNSHKIVNAPSFSLNIQPETYIVQVPKDQTFSVPPPEHANIIEQYKKENEKKSIKGSNDGCCSPHCFSYMFGALMVIGMIVGLSIGLAHALIQPKLPIISIKSLHVNNPKLSIVEFDATITVKDDGKMSISPNGNGDVTLMYKNIEIGSGKLHELRVGSGELKTVFLRLKAGLDKKKFPTVLNASMSDKKGKSPISVWLTMRIPVVMSVSGIMSQNKEIDVNCNLSVTSLGANKGVTSQKCQAKFI